MELLPSETIKASVFLSHLPQLSQLISTPTIIGGAITGIIFYAVSMYCHFYAISLSTNEFFMMFRSFQAVCTYIVEYSFALFTALPLSLLNLSDWVAAFAIILSSVSMIMIRSTKGRSTLELLKSNS